jgi:hypothetical protein
MNFLHPTSEWDRRLVSLSPERVLFVQILYPHVSQCSIGIHQLQYYLISLLPSFRGPLFDVRARVHDELKASVRDCRHASALSSRDDLSNGADTVIAVQESTHMGRHVPL